jgi:hypothetical protein
MQRIVNVKCVFPYRVNVVSLDEDFLFEPAFFV